MLKKLLFVEDSAMVLKVLRRLVDESPSIDADFAESLAQAKALIQATPEKYFAAVVDLNLPDAPHGEVVDLTLQQKIPTVVLTATYKEETRDLLFKKGIVDYVIKENRYSYAYAMKLITRLCHNHEIKVMVVDDSRVARKTAINLLQKYQFQVIEADGAKSAIRQLIDQPDIKLVITDYNMPDVDGFELVKLLRGKYDKQDLTIIGLSGDGDASLSARFIKNGANDFLRKPFNQEEFYCRIMHNIESLETIALIRDAANRDFLTHLYNRQHFCQLAESKIIECQRNHWEYAVAILEVDDFIEFNNLDSEYGEELLVNFAQQLSNKFGTFLCARLNASQLVVMLWRIGLEGCQNVLNDFREGVKNESVCIAETQHYYSISIGFCYSTDLKLKAMLTNCSDLMLRTAEAGKDVVLYD